MSTSNLFITSVEVARIEAMGMGPTIRSKVEYRLPGRQKIGDLDSVVIVDQRHKDDGRLVMKLGSALANKVLIRMKIHSTPCDKYCVLELNVGMTRDVKFDFGVKTRPLTGPTVVIKGEDVHIFNGSVVKVLKGIVKRGERLDVMFVESAVTILSPIKRTGVRLIIPQDTPVTLTGYINTEIKDIDDVDNNIVENKCGAGTGEFKISRSRL